MDNGTDVATERTLSFAAEQGMTTSNFVPNRDSSRGLVERPHRDWKRYVRLLLTTSSLPPKHGVYLFNHARRLYNLTLAVSDQSISKHEAYYRRKPLASALLHTFGTDVVILRRPAASSLLPRGVRGRWYVTRKNSGLTRRALALWLLRAELIF